jgi:hypothetical protein
MIKIVSSQPLNLEEVLVVLKDKKDKSFRHSKINDVISFLNRVMSIKRSKKNKNTKKNK